MIKYFILRAHSGSIPENTDNLSADQKKEKLREKWRNDKRRQREKDLARNMDATECKVLEEST